MKKKILIVLAVLMVLVLGTAATGYFWLASHFKKESIIAQMEAGWNCRAHLDSTHFSLFSSPARVELRGLKLFQRDEEVTKPLNARGPLPETLPDLGVESLTLEVELGGLRDRTARVKQLHVKGLKLRADIDEEGESNLDVLFDDPEDYEFVEVEEEPLTTHATPPPVRRSLMKTAGMYLAAAEIDKPVTKTKVKKMKRKKKRDKERKPFNVQELGMALDVEHAGVAEATVEISDRKSGLRTVLSGVSLSLKGIDVVPTDLANHNRSGFDFAGMIDVSKVTDATQVALFEVSGEGDMRPFDVATGLWKPSFNMGVLIKKGGLLGGEPLVDQLREKDLKKLNEYGLDLSGLSIGGKLQEDATTKIHGVNGKLIVKQNTRLVFPQYEISLMEQSFFSPPEDKMTMKGQLVVSPELSQRILENAEKKLIDEVGSSLAPVLFAAAKSLLVDDQNRLSMTFVSKGTLSDPSVSLDTVDALKNSGKSILRNLLGN